MTDTVRAAVITGPRTIELREFPRPPIGTDDALLRVGANGICGTDVHWHEDPPHVPLVLGHEVVGTIEAIGERAAERWGVQAGDLVAVEAGLACGTCGECLAGFSQGCTASRSYGSNITVDVTPSLWGGLAEYMYLDPRTIVTRLDPNIPAEVAAGWFSPLANALDWLGPIGAEVQPGDRVVIMGPGPQGLAGVLVARTRGARQVIVIGTRADGPRLDAARSLGADEIVLADGDESVVDVVTQLTGGALADKLLDVTGAVQAAQTAPLLVRRRGVIAAASPLNAPEPVGMPLPHMVWKQIRWQGVLSNRTVTAGPAAALLASAVDLLTPLVTHRFGIDEADRAIEVAGLGGADGVIKVVVSPRH